MGRISSAIRAVALFSAVCSSLSFVAPALDSFNQRQCGDNNLHRHQSTRPAFGLDDTTDDRLVDIRNALEKMSKLSQSKDESHSMQTFETRIRKVISSGESSIPGAGRGLFATKNIKKGTVIGFFPVDGIGVEFDDGSSICCGLTPEDQTYFDNTPKSNYLLNLFGSRRLGTADFGEDAQLFIDVNPGRTSDASTPWNGHLVNDGATVLENSEQGMLDYYAASQRRKNCVNIPFGPSPLLAVVTTKKVKKGEELFTTYGCLYWMEYILKPDEEVADVTEAVQLQARETAQDLFDAMKDAQVTYAKQQAEIEESFAQM